jgi:aspartyl-tRNA(Asn)/glutamyl-tRNA(Gln) amidotransferase subunit B
MLWQTVIGLEIHAQLNTKTKLFSSAPNHFGDEPNTNISAVCTGQPGTLPILNEEAVKKALVFGAAIKAVISKKSRFDRKSYFYPDSPRNFQITQYDEPIIKGGSITTDVLGVEKNFSINRAHLEDDAGMLKHFTNFAGVDYNRAGTALIEIVSEPCLHSSDDAMCYAIAVRDLLLYLDVSDCNMEEGSLRIDVNISVRPEGEKKLRNRIEIKNINSFSHMQMAIDAEVQRQIQLYNLRPQDPPDSIIEKATYRFDTERKETILMRQKEDAEDYRYFPEPDLPSLIVTQNMIESIAATLPELPREKLLRFKNTLGIPEHFAKTLLADRPLCLYFEQALESTHDAKNLCTWIVGEFTGRLKEKGTTLPLSGIKPENIAELINLLEKGAITGKIAKAIADVMVLHPGKKPSQLVEENPGFNPVSDVATIGPIVDEVLRNNPDSVADYKAGREKAFAFLVGQVMKATKGAASPQVVNSLLKEKIHSL